MEEKLKELGLTEEQIAAIKTMYQESIDAEYVSLAKFTEASDQLTANQTIITELEAKVQGMDALTSQLAEMQDSITAIGTNFLEREKGIVLNHVLANSGTRNPIALKALIDFEKINYSDGSYTGLDEQIAELKKSDSYLFKIEEPTKIVLPSAPIKDELPTDEGKTAQYYRTL